MANFSARLCLRFDQKAPSSSHLQRASRQNPLTLPWYIFCLLIWKIGARKTNKPGIPRFAAAYMASSVIPKEIRSNSIAYFSMEVGLDSGMPTYSGGLGVLAGDTLRAAADLGLPMIGITLLHRKGYFRQTLDANGNQDERPVPWCYEEIL